MNFSVFAYTGFRINQDTKPDSYGKTFQDSRQKTEKDRSPVRKIHSYYTHGNSFIDLKYGMKKAMWW
jgi:hypothetical protein